MKHRKDSHKHQKIDKEEVKTIIEDPKCHKKVIKKVEKIERCSSSSSSDDEKCYKRSQSKTRSCSRSRSRSRSCSRSPSRSRSRSRSCSSRSSHSSRSECEDDLYCKLKKELLADPTMLANGSDCYGAFYTNEAQMVVQAGAIRFTHNQLVYNIDHTIGDPCVFVRKSGLFALVCSITPNQSSQWTFFVNGLPLLNTTVGINSGAGQLLLRSLVPLKKNDVITVRNFHSDVGTVTIPVVVGGPLPGCNIDFVVKKIAPYPHEEVWCKEDKCISKHLKCKFEEVVKKMLCDPHLMLRGSDSFGSVYATALQDVPLEAPVQFPLATSLYDMKHPDPATLIVGKDGIYVFVVLLGTAQFSEFTIFINGVPESTTTSGTNKGANILNLRQLIKLKKGDAVSVVNHSSANGIVTIQLNPGGLDVGVNAEFLLFRVAPCEQDKCYDVEDFCESRVYRKFKYYLHRHTSLMPKGFAPYSDICSRYAQTIGLEQPVQLEVLNIKKDIHVVQGSNHVYIEQDGVYKVVFDTELDQPGQFAMFVNNKLLPATVSGSESGAGQVSMRQLVYLCKGDKVSIRNHTSAIGSVTTNASAGGWEVGTSIVLILFRISTHHCEKKC